MRGECQIIIFLDNLFDERVFLVYYLYMISLVRLITSPSLAACKLAHYNVNVYVINYF